MPKAEAAADPVTSQFVGDAGVVRRAGIDGARRPLAMRNRER